MSVPESGEKSPAKVSFTCVPMAPGSPIRALGRIRSLAVPPAWTDVWICPFSDGHIQATGRDARGRKQYRYHPLFRELRESAKFEHVVAFAEALAVIRTKVREHMGLRGLPREKVLATVVRMLETTLIRIGNMVPRTGDDVPPIGGKGDGQHLAGVALEAADLAPAHHVPQPQRLVLIAGDDVPPIGGKGDGLHPCRSSVALEAADLASARRLSQPQRIVPRAGDDVPPIGGKGDGLHGAGVALEPADLAPARRLPQPQRLVRRARGDVSAIW